MKHTYSFPESFLWGTATASYQVEGATKEEGRGESIWDTFCREPGRIANDHTGDVACDQYHRYKDDIQLMKWLGVKAHRFSISWPRILPKGYGAVNEKGLDYYDRFIDELLANGIEPWPTLYHWDLPKALQDEYNGWESRQTAERLGEYAALVTKRISDRVSHYFTINEMWVFTHYGLKWGVHAPGKQLAPAAFSQVRHHAVLAHGMAVQAIRDNAKRPPVIGIADNTTVLLPVIETAEHMEAAKKATRYCNAAFLTAILEGKYPDEFLKDQGKAAPQFTDEDMKIIGAPLDFVGMNLYSPNYVRANPDRECGYERLSLPDGYPRMDSPWLFFGPQIIYWGPRLLKEIWGVNSVYITENGCSCKDRLAAKGDVIDLDRIMYLRNHLIAARRAVSEGWPLHGYFQWSLLDNFEWADGYNRRFGLFYVNYETQERIAKQSAHYYKEVIAQNAAV